MGNLYGILLPCVLLSLLACSDEAPAPVASNTADNTFQPTGQNPVNCPTPVLPTTLPPNNGQQAGGTNTTPDLSTLQNGFNLQGNNVFGTGEQTGQQGTSVFGSGQQAQMGQMNTGQVTSPGAGCPQVSPPTIDTGNDQFNNPQVQAMINPEERKECNNGGKAWHWYNESEGEKKGECLETFNAQAACDSQFYSQHFARFTNAKEKVEMDGFLSSGYRPHQCGTDANGGAYFSAAKVDLKDTGAEMHVEYVCASQNGCPSN